MTKNRTEVADIDRSLYDFTYGEAGTVPDFTGKNLEFCAICRF